MVKMAGLGFSLLFLFLSMPVGAAARKKAAPIIDSLVVWTGEFSMYLILSYGNKLMSGPRTIKLPDDLREFWNYLASRYQNRRNVLYEVSNEP